MGSWTFVLVTPDGLVTESVPWLLEKLGSVGLRPVAAQLTRLDSDTMLRIYDADERTRPVNLPPRRAFDLWYSLGPGCVVLLHHQGADAVATMLDVKGTTLPAGAALESIRHRGENGLMNLVHCPDDDTAAAAELGIILGSAHADALRGLGADPDERVRRLTVDPLNQSLPVGDGATAVSLAHIVNRIRRRAVAKIAVDGSSDEGLLSLLARTASTLSEERQEMEGKLTSSGRNAVARSYNTAVDGALVDAAERTGNTATAAMLRGLAAFFVDNSHEWRKTAAAMEDSGVYVSEAEAAVLELYTFLSEDP